MSEEQIRKDFEEWMGDGGLSQRAIERNSKGDYILMQTAHAWEVWKAAHTHYAKSAAPVVLPPHHDTARLQHAVWRLEDLLKDDDQQAWKEARKFLERLKKEQWQEAQPQADALDAECFRFWVSEAARSPAAMAKLIMHCTTEDEYRAAITQCIDARKAAIAAAKGE